MHQGARNDGSPAPAHVGAAILFCMGITDALCGCTWVVSRFLDKKPFNSTGKGGFELLGSLLGPYAFVLAGIGCFFAITDGGSLPFIWCASFAKIIYLLGICAMCTHVLAKEKFKDNWGYAVLTCVAFCNSVVFFGYACLAQLGDQERQRRARELTPATNEGIALVAAPQPQTNAPQQSAYYEPQRQSGFSQQQWMAPSGARHSDGTASWPGWQGQTSEQRTTFRKSWQWQAQPPPPPGWQMQGPSPMPNMQPNAQQPSYGQWPGQHGPTQANWQGQRQGWESEAPCLGQPHMHGMPAQDFARLFSGFDGLFQNVTPAYSQGVTVTCSTNGAAFDFDKFFKHFDQAFRPGSSPAAASHAHPASTRGFSFASTEALERLSKTDVKVGALEGAVNALEQQWRGGTMQAQEVRKNLADIEARMKSIECKEIDDVQTGGLQSGKEEARGMKKNQLQRLEILFGRVETLFSQI